MSTDTDDTETDADGSNNSSSGHCSTPDSDGEVAEEIAIISFERKLDTAREIEDEIGDEYESVDIVEYHGEVFEEYWGEYDCFVGLMASGIAMRKTAPLLDDKWDDPAIVVIDEALTWAIPITGGHHGANQVANDLAKLGAVPAMTTASEAAGKQGVESKAKALDTHVVNGDSTVATNLAVLNEELGPVARLDGPKAVLVGDDVTVLKRNTDEGVVLGTGTVSGVEKDQVLDAWDAALDELGLERSDVDFVATGTRKEGEEGLYEAAKAIGAGVVLFVQVVPGISSLQVAASRARTPMEETTFVTLHRSGDLSPDLDRLRGDVGDRHLLILPRPYDWMPGDIAAELLDTGASPTLPALVFERLTHQNELRTETTLGELATHAGGDDAAATPFSDLSVLAVRR